MSYYYVFCEVCNRLCDIDYDYKDDYEKYSCEIHGEVKGVIGDPCLCIGCSYFDPFFPFSRTRPLDGCCDIYTGMSFKMFKRVHKCKHFEAGEFD